MMPSPPLALLLALAPAVAGASPDAVAFLDQARTATAAYRDRSRAIADGFRRIGDDFPGMGEHWIHIGRVFDGAVDASRPDVLTYVLIGDRPVLTGVAWVAPLLEGEEVPDSPLPVTMWHEHTGTLDEEALAPRHDRAGDGAGARLAMLHGWVWLDNPAGPFAADNWALPWRRLGLAPPPGASPAAGRALSLLAPTAGYWSAMLSTLAGARREAALAALSNARRHCEELLAGERSDLAARLAALWMELCEEVGEAAGAEARDRLAGTGHVHAPALHHAAH